MAEEKEAAASFSLPHFDPSLTHTHHESREINQQINTTSVKVPIHPPVILLLVVVYPDFIIL